ncbi:MAG: sulfotransferase [Myxococcota bacterium]|nr:sulfotransferase [Myxococcota bacterium]
MTLPNFLIVGAMKAGTSWLSAKLDQHPDVYVAPEELHFFNDPTIRARGLDWYEARFEQAGSAHAVGEKTAGYLLGKGLLEDIDACLPGVRCIAVLRNPARRAVSQINHHIRYGESRHPGDDDWIGTGDFERIDERFAILERGRYLEQLLAYVARFGRERIHVVLNEGDIDTRPQETLAETCRFLGVDPAYEFTAAAERVHVNRNSRAGVALAARVPRLGRLISRIDRFIPGPKATPYVPTDRDREALAAHYREANRALFDWLGRPMPPGWD